MSWLKIILAFCSLLMSIGCQEKSAVTTSEQDTQEQQLTPPTVCPTQQHEAMTGTVEKTDNGYALRSEENLIPIWKISMAEAVSPRSPDLLEYEGKQVTICGHYDGAAMYEASVLSQVMEL